jgi:hypothetical protein
MTERKPKSAAYVLRTCAAGMTSYGGFVCPRSGMVECHDWQPTPECGNGLHGFLWGYGDGFLADWSYDAVWLVVAVEDWIALEGKVKFPRGEVVFCGSRLDATTEIIRLGARGAVIGAILTGGAGSTLTGGYGSILAGGEGATLTGGYGSILTGGNRSTLTGGSWSILSIKWWDGLRYRIAIGYVGEDGILPNVAYRAVGGKLVPA